MKKTLILSIILTVLISLDVLYACATCFGDPNSKATQGMNLAIITMLTVTGGVLSSFLSFVYILNKRAKDYAKKLSKRDNNIGGN
jgi:heme/copper-type cytochrome/quinol oxidase subunit 2|tara:strand:+ start:3560 stop:3814 length:255 start_codon:yes stop_codon:yes gene_type:complete